MNISKFNFSTFLARAKRHYNLNVDDFIVVDTAALMLASASYYCQYITIAVTPEKFDQLKKFPLADCPLRDHIKLLDGVACRRVTKQEPENKRWSGNCWSMSREYLTAERKAALEARSISENKQKELSREIAMLDLVDATLPATSNKAKALVRIRSAALYLGVPIEDLFLCDQTIECMVNDIKMDNDTLVLGIDNTQWSKIIKKVTVPNSAKFYNGSKETTGYELELGTYIVTMPNALCNDVIQAGKIHYSDALGMTYLSTKFM